MICIKVKVKLVTVVKGDQKAHFSTAIPGIAPHYP